MRQQQFTLYLENKPGELARITARLAAAKVNIDGISVANSSDVALVQMVVDKAAAARATFKALNIAFTVQEVVLIPLVNHPGALARVAEKLAEARVNINYVYATACDCTGDCSCYAVISAPNLDRVEEAWRKAGKGLKKKKK